MVYKNEIVSYFFYILIQMYFKISSKCDVTSLSLCVVFCMIFGSFSIGYLFYDFKH